MTCTWGNTAGSVTVRSVNACGQSAAFSKAITLLTCMAEQGDAPVALRTSELNVYPNPTSGLFIIKSNIEGEFQLLNGMGQLIESFAIGNDEANSKELYIATAGIYYVRAIADGTIQRIVVVE
jgi:hypothetical protein